MTEPQTTDQTFIRKLTEIILANLGDENFGVKELAKESGMSRSGLNRRLNKIAGRTINQFIREVRLLKALEMLRNEHVTASEVSYRVGFSRPAYFNTCFHKYFGYPPGKVKKEYSESPEEDLVSHFTARKKQIRPVWQTPDYYKPRMLVLSVIIIIVVVLVYPKIFKRETLDDLRSSDGNISVAVMPFQNITDERIWDGIQINLISYLSNYEELVVRQKEAISSLLESKGLTDYASITPTAASGISKKLDANVFIYGIVNKTGSTVRVNAQLVNSKTKKVFKSFQIDGPPDQDKIFKIIDSLSVLVKDYLVKSKMEKEVSPDLKPYKYTDSPEAYKYFILAEGALGRKDLTSALDLYSKAVAADSNFIPAIIFLSMRYMELGMYADAKKWCLKAYEKRYQVHFKERIMVDWYYATLFGTPDEEIKYLKQYVGVDDQVPICYLQLGIAYLKLFQYSKAIPEFEKALGIYRKWGIKPLLIDNYTRLILAYHKTGQYKKGKKLLRKAEKDFPDNPYMIYWQRALLEFTLGDTISAAREIEKCKYALKDLSRSEASIITNIAELYWEAGILNKAEEGYAEALSLAPDNPVLMNNLAKLLIDEELDIIKGLNIIENALKSEPDNYAFLDTKGWGLHKLGKSMEALEILKRSWDLKPAYDHSIFLHLEEVKKTASN
jgi:AraC-like DNA-binding protein/tetratricopeptide (TPR) repeat protein